MDDSTKLGLILIVENDKKTAALISLYLEREGYETVLAHDGVTAIEMVRRQNPIFVILDLMLPRLDGWEVCGRLRTLSDVPLLMLTARGEEIDRVVGFMIGADDYLVKPYSPREQVARVKAILRRTHPKTNELRETLIFGRLALDILKHRVTKNGSPLALTPSEFKLLRLLMSNPWRLFTRAQLPDELYPQVEEVVDRVIDVHIGKLRQKIEDDPSNPHYILTIRGFGYQFTEGDTCFRNDQL